tara:strand:- start:1416 stop:1652 length:237 start_codon:yes stop_codon:yes gene_type:complete
MIKDNKNEKKNCTGKRASMLIYGVIQLGSNLIAAVSLAAIALSFCSLNKESKLFNECVEEIREKGESVSLAVNFCNGG